MNRPLNLDDYLSPEDLTPEQRELITENLMAAHTYLGELVALFREHRKTCKDKACTSPEIEAMLNLDRDKTQMLFRMALEGIAATSG
jgi:hypothetical protein